MVQRSVCVIALLLSSLAIATAVDGVAGRWQITITTSDGQIHGSGVLKTDGAKVTGWVGPSETDPIPVDGTVDGSKVSLFTHPQPGRTVAFARCDLTLNGDRMTGTIDTDKGTIEFVRVPQR